MASPQCEDGYVKLANELIERLFQALLSRNQLAVMLLVIRRSYGYQNKSCSLSAAEVGEQVGIDESNARKTLRELVERRLLRLVRPGKNYAPAIYSVQKDWEKWDCPRRGSWPEITPKKGVKTTPFGDSKGVKTTPQRGLKQPPKGGENNPLCTQVEPYAEGIVEGPKDMKDNKDIYPPTPQRGNGGGEDSSDSRLTAAIETLRHQLASHLGTEPRDRDLKRVLHTLRQQPPSGWEQSSWRRHVAELFNRTLERVKLESADGKIGSILSITCSRTQQSLGIPYRPT